MAMGGLAGANLLVGFPNLVPGLPLDGGRVLKSLVWRLSGDVHRATIVAGGAAARGRSRDALAPIQEPLLGTCPEIPTSSSPSWWRRSSGQGATAAMSAARMRRRIPHLVARQLARPYPRRTR